MFYVRLKRALECWPNLSSETSHQTESVRKKRKKVSAFLVKSGAKSSQARLWNHMLAWWLAYLLVRNTFYIDTLRNTTSATFFALLHFSLQIFTPHLYTGDYKLWVWGGFAQPTKPSSNNSLLNGRSNQDIRSWFTFQKKQRITNNVYSKQSKWTNISYIFLGVLLCEVKISHLNLDLWVWTRVAIGCAGKIIYV